MQTTDPLGTKTDHYELRTVQKLILINQESIIATLMDIVYI